MSEEGGAMSNQNEKQAQVEFAPSPEFQARKKRIDDAVNLRKPDRVPVIPLTYTYYPTRVKGISNKEAMIDLEKTYRAWKETVVEYDWDAAPFPQSMKSGRIYEIMGVKTIKWPGGGLPDDQPFQWVEGDYMKQDEYDEALADPAGFAIKKVWPRIMAFNEVPQGLAHMPGPLVLMLSNVYALPGVLSQMFSSMPEAGLTAESRELVTAGRQFGTISLAYIRTMMELGYPILAGFTGSTAFDVVSDMLRGMKGSMLDMYKVPEKLLALVEMFVPFTIETAVRRAKQLGIDGIFIPLHRGAAGFMSDKQFEKFYWPGLKALLLGLIEAGLTPIPYMEGDFTPRLDYLQDLPPKKIMPHWDIVDRKKVKEKLGDTMCFWGNVPASLLCMGTPQQVKDDVKELFEIFGDNGGLIVGGIPGIPDEARPENVRALADAARELS